MKIEKKKLLDALLLVKPGLSSKEVIEQSSSFVFINGLVVAYNDEIAVSYPLDIGIEGAVQSKELLALLGRVKDEEIILKQKKSELFIKGKKFKAGIRFESEINLPVDFFMEKKPKFKKIPEGLLDGIQICIFSAAKENISAVLNTIHVKDDYVESCDNFRLTRCSLSKPIQDELLIPVTAAHYLFGYAPNSYVIAQGWIHFKHKESGLTFSCRTFEEQYPDLSDFIEVEGSPVKIPSELTEILDRMKIFTGEGTTSDRLVTIRIEDNECIVRGENENGWIEEKAKIKKQKESYAFQVSPRILQDIIGRSSKAILSDQALKFRSKSFVHVVALVPVKDK